MISRTSGILQGARNTSILRRSLTLVSGLSGLILLFAGTQANAAPAHFRYVGGHWSHTSHAGWHRYWGGPSIGFYYAPTPVYVVPGYAAPSYYAGPDFWTSNPSFGISLNFGGGGGYYDGGYRSDRYYHGGYSHDRYYAGRPHGDYHSSAGHYHVNNYSGSGHSYSGSHYSGGGHYSGGHSSGGGRSTGGRGHR